MPRIVHLGFGNFHRAHQAWYTQLANNLDGEQWAITGVSMSRSDLRDALTSNGFQYSLGLRGVEGLEVQPMSAHDELLVARLEPEAVIAAIGQGVAGARQLLIESFEAIFVPHASGYRTKGDQTQR